MRTDLPVASTTPAGRGWISRRLPATRLHSRDGNQDRRQPHRAAGPDRLRGGSQRRAVRRQPGPPGGKLARPAEAARQLDAYFEGDLATFDLPLELRGTEFQRRCWLALASIPYGQTVSYGEQARRLGLGNDAARAVGAANGQNPLPIVLPCHRVVGADGSLTGFGGGLHVKRFLLEHEGALLPLG
jgi:O-6-methylguanine DNA methyltransferase